jgi:hypothetical protein
VHLEPEHGVEALDDLGEVDQRRRTHRETSRVGTRWISGDVVVGVARGLVGRADPVHPGLAQRRGHDLQPGRQTVLLGEPARHGHRGDAGEVRRDRREVVEVHGQRVVHLVPDRERGGGRRGRDQHVRLLERRGEVAGDQRADLLRLPVVGVVVARRERVRAEDDPPLDLGAEPGLAGERHDLLGRGTSVDAEAVAHRVEAGEVARHLARQDQVVRGQPYSKCGQLTSTTSAPSFSNRSTAPR